MSATADRRSPTIARRRLSRELRRLRHEAGLTADKVRGDIDLSQGKMNRLETGIGPQPNISDIRVLLDYYKVGDEEREALLNLARLSRERGWWEKHSNPPQFWAVIDEAAYHDRSSTAGVTDRAATTSSPGLLVT
jgi:hypothetical protein